MNDVKIYNGRLTYSRKFEQNIQLAIKGGEREPTVAFKLTDAKTTSHWVEFSPEQVRDLATKLLELADQIKK